MSEYFSGLTPAELERLSLLVEECAEVQQIAMKIMRHGYDFHHPERSGTTNRNELEGELGDLMMAMDFVASRGDVDGKAVTKAMQDKYSRVWKWLHHNVPQRGEIGHPDLV